MQDNSLDLSIITITRDNYDDLIKTLESTEGIPCERVVINGGECPKTREFLSGRPDIVSLTEKDDGIADAFNKGIKLSSKTAIWFLNSGDICIDKQFPRFACEKLNSHEIVFSDITLDHPKKGKINIYRNRSKYLGLGMPYLHPGLIVKRNVFDEVGLFKTDYKIAMDFEFLCRINKKKYRHIEYPKPAVLMDGHGISNNNYQLGLEENKRALSESGNYSGINLLAHQWMCLKTKLRQSMG